MPVASRLHSGGLGFPAGARCLVPAEAVRTGHNALLGFGGLARAPPGKAGKPVTGAYAGTEGEIAPIIARPGGITAATRRSGYTAPGFFMIE